MGGLGKKHEAAFGLRLVLANIGNETVNKQASFWFTFGAFLVSWQAAKQALKQSAVCFGSGMVAVCYLSIRFIRVVKF